MARYALVRPNDTVDRLADNVDPNVQTKTGWRWLLCPLVGRPTYDQTTEIVEGPTYVVGASSVTETWNKRAMTTQEVSDAKDAAVNGINGTAYSPLVKILFNANNRLRVLEGQSVLTMNQFKAQIKALL